MVGKHIDAPFNYVAFFGFITSEPNAKFAVPRINVRNIGHFCHNTVSAGRFSFNISKLDIQISVNDKNRIVSIFFTIARHNGKLDVSEIAGWQIISQTDFFARLNLIGFNYFGAIFDDSHGEFGHREKIEFHVLSYGYDSFGAVNNRFILACSKPPHYLVVFGIIRQSEATAALNFFFQQQLRLNAGIQTINPDCALLICIRSTIVDRL